MEERIEVEVRGVKVSVEVKKLKSWKAFRTVSKLESDASDFEKVDAALSFVSYVAGMDEDEIVQACGGDDAPVDAVIGFVTDVIAGCYPKN